MSTAVIRVRCALGLVLGSLVGACTEVPRAPDTGSHDATPFDDTRGADASDEGTVRESGAADVEELPMSGGDAAVAARNCLHIGLLEGQGPVYVRTYSSGAVYDNLYLGYDGPTGHLVLREKFFGRAADVLARTVALGTGLNANFRTCSHCLEVLADCVEVAPGRHQCARQFFPVTGSARFDRIAASNTDTFEGAFDAVLLEEVTIDPTTFTSTPVAGGQCIALDGVTFLGGPPGTTGDAGVLDASLPDAGSPDGGSRGELSGAEGGLRQMGGASPYGPCSASSTTCAASTPTCTWTSTSTAGVCNVRCTSDAECPAGGSCVAFSSGGRCLRACLAGSCSETSFACRNYRDVSGATAAVCAPGAW